MSLPAAVERKGSVASLFGLMQFDDPALLRAVRLIDVLRSCGRVFTSSTGTAETYSLSSRVDRIDVFVSHNWAVGRMRKFIILLFHFNFDMAIASMIVVNILVCPLLYAASLGTCSVDWGFMPTTASCTILAFCTALFCGHHAREALGLHSQRLFLDKVCISQVDEAAKAQGIRNLGAFLHHSSNLLVCFTGLYLKRLWTMYEFASFLLLHQGTTQGVHVMPSGLPPLVMFFTISFWVGIMLNRVLISIAHSQSSRALALWSTNIMGVIFISQFVFVARVWARQERGARTMFKGFKFDDAVCTDESDRALVRQNILRLMRHCSPGNVATDEEALHSFDEFVRTAGLHAFQASIGGLGCPYRFLLPVCLISFSDNAGFLCFRPGKQPPAWQLALEFNSELVGSFTAIPLAAALCFRLTKCCLGLRGVCDVAYCGVVVVLAIATLSVVHPGMLPKPLREAACCSPLAGVVYFLHCLCVCSLVAFAYRPQRSACPTLCAVEDGLSQSQDIGVADEKPPELEEQAN